MKTSRIYSHLFFNCKKIQFYFITIGTYILPYNMIYHKRSRRNFQEKGQDINFQEHMYYIYKGANGALKTGT